ncbi:TetR/AcrR family transcriptional regulator [Natronolimnobius baerhuensis]|uniref:TetR family transcriptional regulator n=1 Tax=Natronolimnobius baerhuensis TaxID=253108 RepID=A0A202E9S4_9EURY|nr:TetR/AcrR family transcriptional regulator [Natronolimnobius baerhuensis]OVE85016.1 TetR family transcriptional regulator [Natronolimnobius baerhuensis]
MTDPDVRNAIMTATYEALCEHGYTDLTAQDIADRTDKSKSLLFYHYDSKEDLVADFLVFLRELFEERFDETDDHPPSDRLAMFVDWYLYGSTDGDERQSFHTAMLELRTQAPYNDQFRQELRKTDDDLRDILEAILRDGIDTGEFTDHDPEETAALLIAAIDGARTRQLTLDRDEYLGAVRSAIVTRVIDDLLAGDRSFPTEPFSNELSQARLEATADSSPATTRSTDESTDES